MKKFISMARNEEEPKIITFKSELQRIFGNMCCFTSKKFIGHSFYGVIDDDIKIKAEFKSESQYRGEYDGIKIWVINRNIGLIDKITILFKEVWGKKPAYHHSGEIMPELRLDNRTLYWYEYQPTDEDMQSLSDEIVEYIAVYKLSNTEGYNE